MYETGSWTSPGNLSRERPYPVSNEALAHLHRQVSTTH